MRGRARDSRTTFCGDACALQAPSLPTPGS